MTNHYPSTTNSIRLIAAALTLALHLTTPSGAAADSPTPSTAPSRPAAASPRSAAILAGARAEVEMGTPYIMDYEVLKYPSGDVTSGTGVCTDLVIRAFRHAGIDLQKAVHEDRVARPAAYPTSLWEKKKADRNIDHRRCPNLVAWLKKNAESLPISTDADALKTQWKAGDIVFYVYEGSAHPWHVAIVSDRRASDGMPMIIDNFPPRTSETHRLDDFVPIHSHFRMRD